MLQIDATQRCVGIFGTAGDKSVRLADGNLRGANGGADLGSGRLTPRQAQILALAANGLSDKQIAKRLGVTHRTVRTHFEKLFHDRGIRNRSQAIAIWSARSMEHGHRRPANE